MRWLKSGEVCKELQISYQTLKRWKDKGIIEHKVITPRKILYDVDSITGDNSIKLLLDDDKVVNYLAQMLKECAEKIGNLVVLFEQELRKNADILKDETWQNSSKK